MAKCPKCKGSGSVSCNECNGTGEDPDPIYGRLFRYKCYHCIGSGKETCNKCHGTGKVDDDPSQDNKELKEKNN